ncbi:HAMP domain-containing histidine kinase, partial [Patescibacteria group bacterium]|nr:HAMP domain-containing histidine kinase [Patescibacteria group bacterium]
TIARVGLLRKQIEETEQEMTFRIVGGLSFLYAFLFVIVWRASRTIRRQAGELASYAETLEERVEERTHELEESTKRQLKQAAELARLKDEFVFIAAHELKSPITNLRWGLDAFLSATGKQIKTNQVASKSMQGIKKATARLANLASSLLDVARLESGTVKVSVHATDLISVIQEMVLQFMLEAEKQGIRIIFSYDSSKKFPFILSDSERLKEVFSNLISNGIKYNSKGGKVEISVIQNGGFLEVRVADTGIGMTEQQLSKLFTKFWRADPQAEGTGLGLWITKQLVERMGGSIAVESKKSRGSTFTVRFPIAKRRGILKAEEQPSERR